MSKHTNLLEQDSEEAALKGVQQQQNKSSIFNRSKGNKKGQIVPPLLEQNTQKTIQPTEQGFDEEAQQHSFIGTIGGRHINEEIKNEPEYDTRGENTLLTNFPSSSQRASLFTLGNMGGISRYANKSPDHITNMKQQEKNGSDYSINKLMHTPTDDDGTRSEFQNLITTKNLTVGGMNKVSNMSSSPTSSPERMRRSSTILTKQALQVMKESSQNKISKPKNGAAWWPMEVGKANDDDENNEAIQNLKNHDVYPLSISYSKRVQRKMRIYRIISLLFCMYVMSPISIYYDTSQVRIGFYANTDKIVEVKLKDIVNNTFTLDLTNCQTFWYQNEGVNDTMKFQFAYAYGTPFTSNKTQITVNSHISSRVQCIVHAFFPINVTLPNFRMRLNGTIDNQIIDDKGLHGQALDFGNNSLVINGESAYITLNNHLMGTLNITLHYSLCNIRRVQSQQKNVYITFGYYNELIHADQQSNLANVGQGSGIICMVAPYVQEISRDDTCLKSKLANATCSQSAYLCGNDGFCNDIQQVLNVYVKDGPVQIRYYQSYYDPFQRNPAIYVNNTISLGTESKIKLNFTAGVYKTDTGNDRIAVLQTVGIDYAQTWAYTNRFAYLEAQVWSLSFISLTLLRPLISYQKVVVIDDECPARGASMSFSSDINDFYQSFMPSSQNSLVTMVVGTSQFYKIKYSASGDYALTELKFQDNSMMVAAFIISGVLSLLASLTISFGFVELFKHGKKEYAQYVENQRKLVFTKYQAHLVETEGHCTLDKLTFQQSQFVEIRGVFTSVMQKETKSQKKSQSQSLLQINFSIYQIPALLVDYIFRKFADSMKAFILTIDQSKYHFTDKIMRKGNLQEISLPLSEFQKQYSNYCQIMGYQEVPVTSKIDVLKQFGLFINYQKEIEKAAYANMRFKTQKEKLQRLQGIDNGSNKNGSDSLINQFLADQCIASSFSDDFIFLEDLEKAFLRYCDMKDKPEAERTQIVNSDEIKSFGANIKHYPPHPVIVGVKQGKLDLDAYDKDQQINFKSGLIRKQVNLEGTTRCKRALYAIGVELKNQSDPDKFCSNFLLVVIHFCMIMICPFVFSALIFLGISEMTKIQQGVFKVPVTINDVFYPNRLSPYYTELPYFNYFLHINIYSVVFMFFAFLELLSFYITNCDNQGKFPVRYTILKRIIVRSHQFFLFFVIYVIFCMICLGLIWAVLGAIINPTKFLPYAAASLTFINTIMTKYTATKKKYALIITQFMKLINGVMQGIVAASIAKLILLQNSKSQQPDFKKVQNKQNLSSDIKGMIKMNVPEEAGKDGKLQDATILSKVASNHLGGLQPTIIETALAIQSGKQNQIIECVQKLSGELNMDKELMISIVELGMSSYNPDKYGIRELDGNVLVSIKKLFRRLFPQLNVDLLGQIILVVTEGDSKALVKLLDKHSFKYQSLFYVLIFALYGQKDKTMLKKVILRFVEEIFEKDDLSEMFSLLIMSQDGDINFIIKKMKDLPSYYENKNGGSSIWGKLNQVGKNPYTQIQKIGFEKFAPLICMIAMQQKNPSLTRLVINLAFEEKINEMNEDKSGSPKLQGSEKQSQVVDTLANKFYQCLYLITKGEDIDFKNLNKLYIGIEMNTNLLEELHNCAYNSPTSFSFILNSINCTASKSILLEFYQFCCKKQSDSIYFSQAIKIGKEKSKSISYLIVILYRIFKFEIKLQQFQEEKQSPKKKNKAQAKLEQELKTIKKKILKIVILLNDRENFFQSFEFDKLKLIQQKDNLLENSFETAHGPEEMEDFAHGNEKDHKANKKLEKIIDIVFSTSQSFIKADEKAKGDQGKETIPIYQIFFKMILETQQIRFFLNQRGKQFIRSYAIVMLKADDDILQNDINYINCLKSLSELFKVQTDQFEFLIDSISGSALDIFKVQSKNVVLSSDKSEFVNVEFDMARSTIISKYLKVDPAFLNKICAYWYNESLIISQAKSKMPQFLKKFKIKPEFIKILQEFKESQEENNELFDSINFQQLIIKYLKKGIEERQKLQNSHQSESKNYYFEQTDILFSAQENKDFTLNDTVNAIGIDDQAFDFMSNVLKIKEGDTKIIKQLMDTKQKPANTKGYLKIMKLLLSVKSQSYPGTVFNILQKLSKLIPLFEDYKIDDKGKHKINHTNQNMFVQLTILINSFQLQSLCRNKGVDEIHLGKVIHNIIDLANKNNRHEGIEEVVQFKNIDSFNLIRHLYDNDYFQNIAKRLFECLGHKATIQQCNLALGIMLGATSEDVSLLRQSVIGLLAEKNRLTKGKDTNLVFLNGLAGALQNDLESKNDILKVCKQLDLEGALITDIIDLMSDKPKNFPQMMHNLFEEIHSGGQFQIFTSLIYLLKNDLSNIKPISKIIGVESDILLPILAAAVGNTSLLSSFYSDIAEKFGLQNHNSVRFTIEISKGETQCFQQLSLKRLFDFYIPQPELFTAVIYLISTGKKVFGQKISNAQQVTGYLGGALSHLYRQLRLAFGFDIVDSNIQNKREKQGKKQINQKNSKKLKDSLHILFNALWNDQQFIEIIVRKLHGGIWNLDFRGFQELDSDQDYQAFTYQIKETLFKTKLQQVVDNYDSKQKKLLYRQKELMNLLKTNILPYLDYQAQEFLNIKKPEYESVKIESQRLNYIIKLQRFKDKLLLNSNDAIDQFELQNEIKDNPLYKDIFDIGCTFGLGLFKKLRQPIYYCLSCNRDVQNEALNICLPCALYCHKGHIIKARNYGPMTKTQCDCGTGKFSTSKRYLNQSPLNHKTNLRDNGDKSTVWDEQWTCSVLRKHVNKIQKDLNLDLAQEIKLKKLNQQNNRKKTEEDRLDELIDNYSDSQFFQDISNSIELPDYYGFTHKDQVDPRNKFLNRIDIESGIKLYGIFDDYLDRPVSFVENLILLSSGRSTDSFTALLASPVKFNKLNHKNQSVYDQARIKKTKKKQNSRDAIFKTLGCFISIVKGDKIGFQRYGQGYCDVLGESGTSDYSAKDNMINILILSNGGKLPTFQSEAMSKVTKKLTIGLKIFGDTQEEKKEEEKKLKMNTYQQTLYKMFGSHGKKVMALHKLLTLNKRDLLKLAQINDSEGGSDNEFKNLYAWINDLLGNLLQQDSKNQDWIKSVIRLCCNDIEGLNFIAQEKKISPKDTAIYKGLLNANLKDIMPVFEDLDNFIDTDLNIQLFNVWKYDEDALINFIFENAFNLNPKDETVDTLEQKKYMKNLYQLLAGNTLKLNKRILKMLIFLLHKNNFHEIIAEVDNVGEFDDDEHIKTFSDWQMNESQESENVKKVTVKNLYPELYRYTNALLSIHGIISDNFIEIPYICKYFDVDQKVMNENLASSLISIPYKIWTDYDIQIIFKKLMKANKKTSDDDIKDKKCIEQASSILSASEGDLISLGKVSDEIFSLECTHMKSLIVSLITGNTKYDLGQEKSKKNLLKREIYYVYEKIVRLAFKEMKIYDYEVVDQFLVNSFDQKMPLLLFSAISEDVKLAQKIFDPAGEFSSTLIHKPQENDSSFQQEAEKKKGKEYLNCFLDFIYPSILTENIKPLLKYMKLIKGQQITKKKLKIDDYSIFKDFEKLNIEINEPNLDKTDSIKFNQREIIETIMSSLQLDKRAFISLYKTFHGLFDDIPVLSNILSLIFKLMEERKHEIFDNLPSVVAFILKMFKDSCFSDQEFNGGDKLLMNCVVKWMEFIMIILDKENKYNDKKEIKMKLIQTIQTTLDFYIQTKESSHCLKNQQQNPIQAVDVMLGMMNMAKMNFSDMKQMALKIGGFPQADKLEQFFKVTQKHSSLFNFGNGGSKLPSQNLPSNGTAELSEFNMKSLFDYFSKNNKGAIGVEEFQTCCKHMGINALGGRELKVFASVDKRHTGKLNFQQFQQALQEMQLIIVKQSMDQVGSSVNTLVLGIIWTVTLLILLITFIFIGIEAFSPVTQFSSVMNSLLPIGAGSVVKGKGTAATDKGVKDDKASSAVSSSLGKAK